MLGEQDAYKVQRPWHHDGVVDIEKLESGGDVKGGLSIQDIYKNAMLQNLDSNEEALLSLPWLNLGSLDDRIRARNANPFHCRRTL